MTPALVTTIVAIFGFFVAAGLGVMATSGGTQAKTLKRAQSVVARGGESREGKRRTAQANTQDQRRKQILKTLKDQERQQKRITFSIAGRMQQAGLGDNVRGFWIASGVLGVVALVIAMVLGQPPLIAVVLGACAALGLPRWVVGLLANKRMNSFTAIFPDAMDIIVRGIRSGLPVHDSLRVIGAEAPEPLASEFKRMVESIGMGISIDQALEKMYERMPTPEVRFFAIVLAIQSKTGGNLAEALANLSTVIRARKLMREKIKALSGEAVASAVIIGCLPPGVVTLISIVSPAYMLPMFSDPRGRMLLIAGGVWMSIGIFAMRRMINFKI